jgi:ABC-type branched-subunit amino acid transport system substrate-binding protein/ABC-type amino acid transport substrate-binding protein
LGLLLLTLASLATPALAQGEEFSLLFCSQVANYPMSDRERGGFDIELAAILADELGAEPGFVWTNFDDIGIRDTLHSGLCDVAIGVGEGVGSMLTTVPYLNASYAFVTREGDGLNIESLDDPQLANLRIATYQNGLPTIALRNRNIVENVMEIAAIVGPHGVDANTPILDTLLADEADVAIVYGPAAAARAAAEGGGLSVTRLTPEVDMGASLIQLSRILTIGVRPQDEALRDALNRALAHRWSDVTAILDAYGIPRFPVAAPIDAGEFANASKVGVIFPARTPAVLLNSPTGEDALRGAAVAENAVSLRDTAQSPFLVLNAHAPTVEAVERAALRMVLVDHVDALIGGYDPLEAEAIARIAAEHDVAFFNVGSEDARLRNKECYPTTFHVAPSTAMVAAATLGVATDYGGTRVHAVVERGSDSDALVELLIELAQESGATVVGHTVVEPNQFVYYPVFQEFATSGADTVLLVLSAESQEAFLSQAPPEQFLYLGVTPLRGQSRPYLQRFSQVAPGSATDPRVVAWDPALESPINSTFSSRTGEPLEPTAWATYAAVVIAFQASQAGEFDSPAALGSFLSRPGALPDIGKSDSTVFRPEDGQMLQELYVISVDPAASWGRSAATRTALAQVMAVVPAEVSASARLEVPMSCEAP